MRKYILIGGISLFVSLYSHAQLGLFHSDEADIADITSAELFSGRMLPDNGAVTGIYPDGKTRYTATVKNARLHGAWKSWYDNNAAHDEGYLRKGIPDGEWKVWYPNGKVRFVRTYSADKYARIRQEWLRPHPKMPNYPLTTLYQKNRSHAVAVTKSTYSFKDAIAVNSYMPAFVNCLHHGVYINYYESGAVKDSGQYKNGLRNGVWIEAATNEHEYWSGNYTNGVRNGTWKKYDRQKKMNELIEYKGGKEAWRKTFSR
jgi:antitoxin component YwqK of YwqJK toxin-antitoxin module